MFNQGELILNIALSFMIVWIVDKFWGSFFEKRKASFRSVLGAVLYFAFQMFFQSGRGSLSLWAAAANMAMILLVAVCRYYCRGKGKYFLLLLFYSVGSLLEVFVFFLVRMMKVEKQVTMGAVISTIIMFLLVYTVSNVWNRAGGSMMPNKFYLLLLLIPAGSIYIAIHEFYDGESTLSQMVVLSILLLFNIVVFEIYVKMNEMFMQEKEKTVHAQQLDLIAGNMAEQERVMEESREERHNLVNELIVLQGGIENGEKETVLENLERIIKKCHSTEAVAASGNSAVDAVINFKYAVAKEQGIAFRLKTFIPYDMPVEPCDIGVILGNALDNAIEAAGQCKTKEKIIDISMGIKKGAWVVLIENPYENEIRRDKRGRFLSTKAETRSHGYGLKSMEKAAEKYDGEVIIEAKDGIFSLMALLNLKGFCE